VAAASGAAVAVPVYGVEQTPGAQRIQTDCVMHVQHADGESANHFRSES
jgi:hypothetical protein